MCFLVTEQLLQPLSIATALSTTISQPAKLHLRGMERVRMTAGTCLNLSIIFVYKCLG